MDRRTRVLFALFMVSLTTTSCASLPNPCYPNWTVTGYYTPVEHDYTGPSETVQVVDHGEFAFPRRFLSGVKMEGWGKTRHDWYLGYYGNQWHRSDRPLDATGQPLSIGTVATDPKRVASGSTVVIASLDDPFTDHRLIARDVGALVKRDHIDVYTGEGKSAQQLTWRITGQRTVCIYPA